MFIYFVFLIGIVRTLVQLRKHLKQDEEIIEEYISSLVTIFDVICTNSGEGKFTSGIIVYVLSILAVAMACILYFANSGMTGLATEFFNLFISVSLISLITTGFLIATWCVSENRVEHSTTEIELGK